MKIGPVNTILVSIKVGKVSTKTHLAKTVPASYTLPIQMVSDPKFRGQRSKSIMIITLHSRP